MQPADTIRAVLENKGWGLLSVEPDVTVYEAVRQMADNDIGALAVIGSGRLQGIFSERDYARKIILLGRSSKETQVGEVMSFPAMTVAPDASVESCMRMMTTYRLRHLIVIENGQPVGIVSIGDLVNQVISAQGELIGQLNSYIGGAYPG